MDSREWLRSLQDDVVQVEETEPASSIIDPCARLGVKPIAGGIPDAPIVKHDTYRMKRAGSCVHRGKCSCERVYLPDHRETFGICMCPPVDVERHNQENVGIRVKGIPTPRKALPKDRSLAGRMGHADLRGPHQATTYVNGQPDTDANRMVPRLESDIPYVWLEGPGRIVCTSCLNGPYPYTDTRRVRCERRPYRCESCGQEAKES